MKEYKERDRGTGIEIDPLEDEEELPYLSGREKKFCRLYLKYGSTNEGRDKAGREVYENQKYPTRYVTRLLSFDKIQHYIEFLREDICEIKDAEGQAKYSIQARVKELERLIGGAEDCNNFQAAANFQTLKENLIGKRRKHALNLAKYQNDEERRQALFDAVSTGEMEAEEFKVFIKALQQRQEFNITSNFSAEIPDNGKVGDD